MGYSREANHQQAPYKKREFENKKAFNPGRFFKEDKCHKCGDSKHIEGFQCSACKYQCRYCLKFGHFSSLCYRKQESYKKKPRSLKAYQLTNGRLSTQDNAICSHSSNNPSSDESFCLQMKFQAEKANAKYPQPWESWSQMQRGGYPMCTKGHPPPLPEPMDECPPKDPLKKQVRFNLDNDVGDDPSLPTDLATFLGDTAEEWNNTLSPFAPLTMDLPQLPHGNGHQQCPWDILPHVDFPIMRDFQTIRQEKIQP